MLTAPIPQNEEQRLAALDSMELLYAPSERAFDAIVHRLAEVFGVPVATMSLIDRDTQFYMSQVGLPPDLAQTRVLPREMTLCNHVVGNGEMIVVNDMADDARFSDSLAVVQGGMRFYAGAPLRSEGGYTVGSLCIFDRTPREITEREKQLLQMLADALMTEVKLRKISHDLRGISHRLASKQRAIEHELREAKAVQQFLLPPPQQAGHGMIVCHAYHPFDHIGGDFLDVRLRDDGSAVLLLADVSGHGLSAALTSAMTKTSFQRLATTIERPYDLLTGINADLVRTVQTGRFMTAVAALYRPEDGSVEISSAGHPYPLLLRGSSVQLLTTPNELPLLIDTDTEYSLSTRIEFRPGDRLLLYTDGAIEAADPEGEMLAFEGLSRMVENAHELHGEAFLKTLFDGISTFAHGKIKDDVALVTLECTP